MYYLRNSFYEGSSVEKKFTPGADLAISRVARASLDFEK
jgi:hypothetical protein